MVDVVDLTLDSDDNLDLTMDSDNNLDLTMDSEDDANKDLKLSENEFEFSDNEKMRLCAITTITCQFSGIIFIIILFYYNN